MLEMLKKLHKQSLHVNINRYEFSATKVKYLSMIITTNSIEIDTEKVKAIQKWEALLSVKDV